MAKVKNIAEGYTNLVKAKLNIASELIEEMSKERMDLCNACVNKSENGRCALCGCVLAAKTRSPEDQCPERKWLKKDFPTTTTES
jgi:hypothetical protein